jgi:deoxyribonuclease IV
MAKILIGMSGSGKHENQTYNDIKLANIDCVELPFTYSVWMKKDEAIKVNEQNKKLKLKISIHAPYFINLASLEKQKVSASKQRILKACKIGHFLGAKYIVFHAGFYQKQDKEKIYQEIKAQIIDLLETIKKNKWDVILAPETTGKATQFGSLDELIRLKKETGCHLCVDFSHIRARNKGIIDYDDVMKKLKPLGFIHAHFSGIEWTDKGEKKHLLTEEKDIVKLFKYLIKYDINVSIINESPDPFGDAKKMKKILNKIND